MKSGKYVEIFGTVRESEEIINILQVGISNFLPFIGLASRDFAQTEKKLILLLKKEELIALYKKKDWKQVELLTIKNEDMYKRTPFSKVLQEKLKNSCVAIIGLGTGGSRLAIGFARTGVGHLKLTDPDKFSIENVSRHECDLLDIGRFKVNAVKERIHRINPKIKVQTFPYNIFEKQRNAFFKGLDLVIGATDRTSIQLAINSEIWERKIPTVFGGCYEDARAGEVFFVLHDETPCYECLRGGLKQPERKGQIDYSTATSHEDYKGEPGLHAAINLITDIEEQIAIALLLRNEECELAKIINPKHNYILIAGALAKGYHIFKHNFQIYKPLIPGPRKDCGTCQRKELSEAEEKQITKEIAKLRKVPEEFINLL